MGKATICCLSLTIALVMAACGSDSPVAEIPAPQDTSTTPPAAPVDPIAMGDTPRPVDWIEMQSTNWYPCSMYFTMTGVSAPVPMKAGDMVAAFVNGSCRCVHEIADADDIITFKVRILTDTETQENMQVELRYYSTYYKRIFPTQPLIFVEDGVCGSIKAPYRPQWIIQ